MRLHLIILSIFCDRIFKLNPMLFVAPANHQRHTKENFFHSCLNIIFKNEKTIFFLWLNPIEIIVGTYQTFATDIIRSFVIVEIDQENRLLLSLTGDDSFFSYQLS